MSSPLSLGLANALKSRATKLISEVPVIGPALAGTGSNQPIIPRFGGNVGPTQKQTNRAIGDIIASSGPQQLAQLQSTHSVLGALGAGASLATMVPLGPEFKALGAADKLAHASLGVKGAEAAKAHLVKEVVHGERNQEFSRAIDTLRHGVSEVTTPIPHPDLGVRTLHDRSTPFFNHSGTPLTVGDLSQLYTHGSAQPHFMGVVTNDKLRVPERELSREDILGSSLTAVHPDLNQGQYEQTFFQQPIKKQGVYSQLNKLRNALISGQLGQKVPEIGGSFNNNSMPGVIKQFGRGDINLDWRTLTSLLQQSAMKFPPHENVSKHMDELVNLIDELPMTDKLMGMPPHIVAKARQQLLDALPLMYPKGRDVSFHRGREYPLK